MLTDQERDSLFKEHGEYALLTPESSPEWYGLDERAQRIWITHARRALRLLVRFFKPRRVTLYFESAYQARLGISDESGVGDLDCGAIQIVSEANEK